MDQNIDDDDVFIIGAAAFICAAFYHLRRLRRTSRRWWVRPINLQRTEKGFHLNIFREFKVSDHEEFFDMTRMWPCQFDDLLRRVKPFLPKGGPRRALKPELKLALTLGFLAHGDSPRSKGWEYRVGRSTVFKIIREVCQAIWLALQPEVLPNPSKEMWEKVAEGFFKQWQFPNCIGAVDGKHIRIKAPRGSGSKYHNYKHYFSTVLMAVCDADYKFIWVDIGQYGSVSDGGVWANTDFAKCLEKAELDLPPPRDLPCTTVQTHPTLVADDAFPLGIHMLKPYSRKNLTDEQRIFNYRLSRARRTIENAFGILAARWQILLSGMSFMPDTVDDIVKALVCLHNFIMLGEEKVGPVYRRYNAPGLIDREDSNHVVMDGAWRGAATHSPVFENLRVLGRNSGNQAAKAQRDILCEYFSTQVGYQQVPWQAELALKGRGINQPAV